MPAGNKLLYRVTWNHSYFTPSHRCYSCSCVIQPDSAFRPLDPRERGLIEKLLEAEFLGRDELRSQLGSVTAQQLHDDGTLKLRCASGLPAPIRRTLAIEGECKDADGGTIGVLLHVDKNGFMWLLEILKYGMEPIINLNSEIERYWTSLNPDFEAALGEVRIRLRRLFPTSAKLGFASSRCCPAGGSWS
jgi:hypothetical protein